MFDLAGNSCKRLCWKIVFIRNWPCHLATLSPTRWSNRAARVPERMRKTYYTTLSIIVLLSFVSFLKVENGQDAREKGANVCCFESIYFFRGYIMQRFADNTCVSCPSWRWKRNKMQEKRAQTRVVSSFSTSPGVHAEVCWQHHLLLDSYGLRNFTSQSQVRQTLFTTPGTSSPVFVSPCKLFTSPAELYNPTGLCYDCRSHST